MSHWHLNPVVHPLAVAALAAVVIGVTLLPAFKPMLRWQRWTIVGLRLAVVLLAVVLMLRPTRVSSSSRPVKALLVFLFDQSRSMTVPDMPDGKSRWQAQHELLDETTAVLSQMPPNIETKIYAFDAAAHEAELVGGALAIPTIPEGSATDHGTSLDDVLRQQRGKRLAAVIVTGDGAQRAYAPRVEMQQAAREVRRLGAPLYTVAFGKDTESSQARDVAIENLRDHYTVFVKNELPLQAALRVRGFVNQPIAVELVIEDSSGKQTVLGPVQHKAQSDGQLIDLAFNFTPQETGQYRLTLRAAEQSGELVTKNNEMTAFLTVRDGGLKVLYLDTRLPYEFGAIKRALGGAEDIQLDMEWIKTNERDRWPKDYSELFRNPQYDVFILGTVPAAAFTADSITALRDAVDAGKGLMLIGGDYSYGPGRWAGTPAAEMLPLALDIKEAQDLDAQWRKDRHWEGPLQMLPARPHYITNLAASAQENRALWESLPPLKGANRFDKLTAQAIVLAETTDRKPLLVARNYGTGRVLAFAGDTTWQWAMHGQLDAHRRFWRQSILWLAHKDDEQKDSIWIDLVQRRFNPGGRVEFTTGIKRGDGGSAENITLTAQVVRPDGVRESARLVPEAGKFLGLFKETAKPGNYTIEVKTPGIPEPARTRFVVLDEDLELANPSASPDAFDALSEVTKAFGGKRVAREDLIAILKKIKDSPPELQEQVQERFELGRTLGTAWLFFLMIVGLMSGEWYLRKKWGLV